MENKGYYIDEFGQKCPCKPCPKVEEPKTCGDKFKKQWEEYLDRCEPEPEIDFDLCRDYDPNQVYFMQYRPKTKAL